MSFIPEITCSNCKQKYSALRSRCPHCGTRHVKRTMRTTPTTATGAAAAAGKSGGSAQAVENSKWQLIFGGILIAAVIIAVIILITASLTPSENQKTVETPPLANVSPTPSATPTPTPTPSPTPSVTSLTITFLGTKAPDSFTQRIEWSPIQLKADVYPKEALDTLTVNWRSSDPSVATVEDGLVTAVGRGTCQIIAECGGLAQSCTVLVP